MKIICVGRNYALHAKELGNAIPKDPVIFLKPDSAVLQNRHPFVIPPFTQDVHHELEVIVRISRLGRHIDPSFSHRYYDALSVGIDFTARDLQEKLKKEGLPWEKSKGFDGSAVIGTWIAKTELPAVNELSFHLLKNQVKVQEGSTHDMLFGIDELVGYVSTFFTLKKGDIIFTGTPAGVAKVESGDVLEGFLENRSCFRCKVK
jgi:2-keto-4-pentenoate hydratase/2-oxohepta-3-ene-1,7-dioic acid hydratase in catechol pathway